MLLRTIVLVFTSATLLTISAACGSHTIADDIGTGDDPPFAAACNPLGGQGCLLPWPSMTYLTADPSTATGYRLDLPADGMAANLHQVALDPTPFNRRWDGFSPTGPILAMFDKGVATDKLPPFSNPDASLAADAPIVLLDLDRNVRVPFFAEVDQNVSDPAAQALIIRPLIRLTERTHYAVAIRKSLKSADGSELPMSAGFLALRDGVDYPPARFADLAASARATGLFAKLAAAGVATTELVLAWDFVTASDAMLQGDLTAMRADALAAIGDAGAGIVTAVGSDAATFTVTAQANTAQSFRRYLGTFKAPNFLTDGEADDSILARDPAGRPAHHGLRDANLAAIIPACVQTSQDLPRPTVIFGHGLFGSGAGYLDDPFVQALAEDHCLIILAGDFIGLTDRQLGTALAAVVDLNKGPTITEKLGQSVIDFMTLEALTRGPIARSPLFAFNGKPVIDPKQVFYVGGSLGGIMGNVLMAYDPSFTRGVLAVPGGAWSMLIERSNAWSLLKPVIQGAYPLDRYAQNVALFGMAFEPYDPITTAAHVIKDPLFGQAPKSILMWYAEGDALVSNLTTELVAREMGISMIGPPLPDHQPWHVPVADGPLANGIVQLNDHPTPLPPTTNVPPAKDNGTHSGINRKAACLRMVERFLLAPEQAIDGCALAASPGTPAPCDCATGACD